MKRICARCNGEGHFAKTCIRGGTPWAQHMLETGRCRRCGAVRENSAVHCERCRIVVNREDQARRMAKRVEMGAKPRVRSMPRCSDCGLTGHNSATCKRVASFCREV